MPNDPGPTLAKAAREMLRAVEWCMSEKMPGMLIDKAKDLRAALDALTAERDRMRAALEPFAARAAIVDGNPSSAPLGDAMPYGIRPDLIGDTCERHLTLGDLRRARRALDEDEA